MSSGAVHMQVEGSVARIWFDRPEAMNSMTWKMYNDFEKISLRLQTMSKLRAIVLRGVGGKAFVAGTDIHQFSDFDRSEHGVEYEKKMDRILNEFVSIPAPTLAVIDDLAIGGGLNIAASCDLRLAATGARFGVPISRTLGNCLSMRNYANMISLIGEPASKRMLFLAELMTAEELAGTGFLARVVPPQEVDTASDELIEKLCSMAPLTITASKKALQRLRTANLPSGEDLIELCYGSSDFQEGVQAFKAKRRPNWTGK